MRTVSPIAPPTSSWRTNAMRPRKIVGSRSSQRGEDREANAVSFRFRDGTQDNGVPVEEAIERIVKAVREREVTP